MKTDLVATGYIFSNNKVLLVHHNKLNLWLPVGGHINKNENFDEALKREIKEETNLDIEILNQSYIPLNGNVKKNLATPFYVNVHSVGDHDHCSLFYICKALNPKELKPNNELKDFKWFSKDNLNKNNVPADVKNQAIKAFELFDKLNA
jgi:ADP-ribose pyrophosphatase YjhB (NUDIX family)